MANLRVGRRSGLVLRGGRQRRQTRWADVTETVSVLAAASTAVISNVTSADFNALRPYTIVRVRGVLHLVSDQQAASEDYSAAFGIAVVSDQAAAIGVSAVPTPITDRGSDLWLVYEELASRFVFGSGVGFENAGGIFRQFDSRAMRKVEDGDQPTFVKETSSQSNGVRFYSAARLLIKLH